LPEFTPNQKKAVDEREKNILVAAAAGSGKTAVLVERILQVITEERGKNSVDISRLLVVTFTDAAASEMRERLLKALNERQAGEPANKHIAKQIMLMPKASISTIHSFCNSVLKSYYSAAGLDPSFRIGDITQLDMIKDEVLDSIFNACYEEKDLSFYRLLDIYGGRFYDKDLRELILRIHNFCESSLDPNNWLTEAGEMFNINRERDLGETLWGQMVVEQIKDLLKGADISAKEAIKYCEMPGGPHKYIAALNSDIDGLLALHKACDGGNLESIKKKLNSFAFEKLASIREKDQVDPELKDIVKAIREKKIKSVIGGIGERYFFKPFDLMIEDVLDIYPLMRKLCELAIEFREKYSEEKHANNILDFGDLEHYTYKVLSENEGIAAVYKDFFYEIYTDEYQDSNILQENILNLIARDTGRFMVGDVKQSIYKFRRANPDIFINKYNAYKDFGENLKIDLSMNFRSRKNVLDSVNFLFKQLMSADTGGIGYGDAERLRYGANFLEENYDDTTELILVETKDVESEELSDDIGELDSAEKEASVIALRILSLTEYGSPHRAEYGDIAVLLRSLSHAQAFISTFAKAGIPAFANTGSGFFDSIEVLTLLSLLKIIDNPMQDISLLSVLHSPIYSLSADDLVKIRTSSSNGDFYSALTNYFSRVFSCELASDAEKTVYKFLADLRRWRRLKSQLSVSKLISLILDESGYYDYVTLTPQAKRGKANLMAFFEQAAVFEKTGQQGLFRFIGYIEKLKEKDGVIKDSSSEKSKNAVEIMTIHRSKGLEFPICFVSNLGRKINRSDEFSGLILHQDKGLGPIHISQEPRVKSNTLPRAALANLLHNENYAEELRILYVALTRAKRKLILTGCVNNYEKTFSSWAQTSNYELEKLPPQTIYSAATYLDFVGPCLARHKGIAAAKFLNKYNEEVYNDESRWKVSVINAASSSLQAKEADTKAVIDPDACKDFDNYRYAKYLAEIEEKFDWKYENIKSTILPSKISISEIKRNYFSRMKHDSSEVQIDFLEPTFNMPKFAAGGTLTAAEKGMAMHTLMEHMDINKTLSATNAQDLISSLKAKNLLSEQEAASIDINKICNFITSELASRMRRATNLRKEIPFVLELDAKEAYLHNINEGSLLVHGIIDCYFIEDGHIVLVDYKSDYIGKDGIKALKNRYSIQLNIYRKALENSLGLKVSECLLYLFDKNICVNMFE